MKSAKVYIEESFMLVESWIKKEPPLQDTPSFIQPTVDRRVVGKAFFTRPIFAEGKALHLCLLI